MPKPVSYPDSPILVADLLQGNMVVTESRLLRIMHLAYERCGIVEIYRFDEMLPGESLVAHVQRHVEAGTGRGPFQEDTLIFISKLWLSRAQLPDLAAAKVECAKWWSGGGSFWGGFWREKLDKSTQTPIHQSQEWQAFLKNVLAGKQHPFIFPGLFWGTPGGEKTRPHSIVNLPLIFEGPKGQRTWGMVRQTWPMAEVSCQERAVRHLQIIKNSPVAITVVAAESGEVLYQNTSSMSLYGNHGSMDREICLPNRLDKKGAEELLQSLPENWPIEFPGCISEEQYHKTVLNSGSTASDQELQTRRSFQSARFQDDEVGLSFLQLLFLGNKLELQRLKSTIVTGLFYARIQIKSRKLRSWMLLDPDAESYHDLHIASTVEPVTFKKTYIISQTDVTDTVMAQKELSEERERMRAVLQRQYELIEVMQSSDRSKPSADGPSSRTPFQEKIQILREILSKGVANSADEADGEIHTTKVIGQGAFGTVFLGTWRGTTVAVKRMILPAAMTNSERAHQMAVMEIGISSSMSHPHLVQTYTYSIKALHDEL